MQTRSSVDQNGTSPPKSSKTIVVTLSLPDVLRRRSLRPLIAAAKRLNRRQKALAAAIGMLCIAGVIGVVAAQGQQRSLSPSVDGGPKNPLDMLQRGSPDYATLLPAGKSADSLGGWTRVSPPDRDPVYAYVDRIGPVPVSVSQQPIPSEHREKPDELVRNIAFGSNATTTLQAGNTTVYIGSSTEGPQSVIFTTDGLLILIKATATVSDDDWKEYIQSLR